MKDSKFFEKPLPPITDTVWWLKEFQDSFCTEEFINYTPLVKLVRCKRMVKELQTGTRTMLKGSE